MHLISIMIKERTGATRSVHSEDMEISTNMDIIEDCCDIIRIIVSRRFTRIRY
jgi:hypothetical protein